MPAPAVLPRISVWTLRFFRRVVRSYFRRHFRAVQVQHAEHLRGLRGPLIVFGNHVSWWDPMTCVLLAQKLLPERNHFAPMDAVPLKRYPILQRIGIFPVELGSPRGAVQFLRTSEAVLSRGGVLWLTPQGRFADVRERPLAFRSGLATLLQRMPDAQLVPIAVEYPFWSERMPETLVRVGQSFQVDAASDAAAITRELEERLGTEMQALQEFSIKRDPLAFEVLLDGKRGTGGFYALGKRIRAWVTGRGFQEDHSARDARVRRVQ